MSRPRLIRPRARAQAAAVAVAGLLVSGLAASGASAVPSPSTAGSSGLSRTGAFVTGDDEVEVFSEEATGLADVDTRGTVKPLASQVSAVPAGATVRWNRYGTPASLSNTSGYLSGPSSRTAVETARQWLVSNAQLFGLSATQMSELRLLSNSKLVDSNARVVRFRQMYGDYPAAVDGMVTLGLTPDRKVAYVASSLARVQSGVSVVDATVAPIAAWSTAAMDVGELSAPLAVTTKTFTSGDWTTFTADGFAQLQRVRQRALALPDGTVRPVFEANVVDSEDGKAVAYTSFVDAVTGKVLIRHNRVDNFSTVPKMTNTAQPFTGAYTATECGPKHPYTVDAATRTITVEASAVLPAEDIVLKLFYENTDITSADTATSPEAIVYSIPDGTPGGVYSVQVCPFQNPTAPVVLGEYVGVFTASEQESPEGLPYPPKWKWFPGNPSLNFSPTDTTDSRRIGCWEVIGTNCAKPLSPLSNMASRAPWDYNVRTNQPSFTSMGNNASTQEAWGSPLTPGGANQRPNSPNRHYGFDNELQDFTDAWNNTKCSPAAFSAVENNNDILASVTNLFAGHNRFHDYSYFLGFTEGNYNMQESNFGNRATGGISPTGGENDPEIGNAQAGALTGGQPNFLGRDNANQITLQDGIPGITNQYLFQPIAAAFYSPCVDGDYDAPVYGHEYTHAISNRMVAGPDSGLSGFQAGSMGESWSDQVALEYLFEHDYDIGTANPWVEGPYVTGNKQTGIRNYALNKNPLQFGDLGYDTPGPEVHSDGEVWSAAMFDVRRQLVKKYNARFPESDKRLQIACADGRAGITQNPQREAPLPAGQCPGGRRWIQLMFDSFLMQESATSMLDARDAYLAADKMRFGGRDLAAIWRGFASDGMGSNAKTKSTEDDQPTPGYASPFEQEGTLRIRPLALGGDREVAVHGRLYVGDYEARVTPIADTFAKTEIPSTVRMVPGNYSFVFQAKGYGLTRITQTIRAGETTTREIHMSTNMASITNGATVDGTSADSLNATSLIDDTEATNWAGYATGGSVDAAGTHPFVNVNLGGGRQVVRSVKVSAMLRPSGIQDPLPLLVGQEADPDPLSGSRFTALRKFAIEVCNDSAANDCSSSAPSSAANSPYTRIYTSPDNAFNGVKPRPLAPALLFKRFNVPDTAATHVRLVALENQCTGQAQFAGDQDNDPVNDTDCKSGSDRDESVRAAELEVFSYDSANRAPGDPVVAMVATGDVLASPGDRVTYRLTYLNLGPKPSSLARIRVAQLPLGLRFVSATDGGVYDSSARALLWRLGTVPVGKRDSVTLTTRVASTAAPGQLILLTAQFQGAMTFSPPAAAVTVVGP